jgi:hypothetical protein
VLLEKPGKLGGEFPGDLFGDLRSSYQPQRHGVSARGLGGASFVQVRAPCSVFTGHRFLLPRQRLHVALPPRSHQQRIQCTYPVLCVSNAACQTRTSNGQKVAHTLHLRVHVSIVTVGAYRVRRLPLCSGFTARPGLPSLIHFCQQLVCPDRIKYILHKRAARSRIDAERVR